MKKSCPIKTRKKYDKNILIYKISRSVSITKHNVFWFIVVNASQVNNFILRNACYCSLKIIVHDFIMMLLENTRVWIFVFFIHCHDICAYSPHGPILEKLAGPWRVFETPTSINARVWWRDKPSCLCLCCCCRLHI